MNKEFDKFLEENLGKVKFKEPKIFKVTIEEHVVETFEIKADDMEEAMQIAEDRYYSGDIVLEPGECTARLMMAEDEENGESTEWVEF